MSSFPSKFIYPISRQDDIIDVYHGVEVRDLYRWLENPDSEETQAWIKAQNKLTFDYLANIATRKSLNQRLTELWNYEKYSTPFKEGDRYFYFKNDGLQNQSVLYTLKDLNDEPKILLDPNTLSTDGTVALCGLAISKNAQYLAYGISTSGSDWVEWKVRNIETKEDLSDHLKWIKFSGASWTHNHQGFFYSRYDEPNETTKLEDTNYYQKLYYHRLGTTQEEDVLIYQRRDQKEWGFNGRVSEDGKYLIINVWRGTDPKNLVFYKDLEDSNSPIIELINNFEASYGFIDNDGSTFWLRTNLNAPKKRIIAIDINSPSRDNWQEIIPETEDTLDGVSILNNQFVCDYLKDAKSVVKIFDIKGNFIREVDLPDLGIVGGFGGKKYDTKTFYSFANFTTPSTIYHYDMVTGKTTLFRQPKVDFNPQDFESKQVFYTGKDGTKIPLFITHKKGLKLDGT
ncbi:MAG TPA: S9 family peptidase, partial [Cyanothece sp. UBA12306]|nr:S9 family peptidase [Cyanothece sp. UBA12306]